jgi:hypothetical protein
MVENTGNLTVATILFLLLFSSVPCCSRVALRGFGEKIFLENMVVGCSKKGRGLMHGE